jgi:hypothetical protein
LLLARVSPETIGTYRLLSVYIGLVVAFLYFGGDTVVIKFAPECAAAGRASFFVSYLAVVFDDASRMAALRAALPRRLRSTLHRRGHSFR